MTRQANCGRTAAIGIINQLLEHGFTAYLAGGCVRDALLGKTPKDYDVATDATPDDVQKVFPRSAPVGAAFGVVLVYTKAPKNLPRWSTEVATFRAEGAYSDGRRPDEVRFTTAQEDAQRRDFTINGLFAQPQGDGTDASADRIIDFVGGREDLEAGVIRAIGDPGDRFGEDYLRMLRAVRFAARLGFGIEDKTSAAIRAHARYLGQISRERIGQELLTMLDGPDPSTALRLLQAHKLDGPTLNEDPSDVPLTVSQKLDSKAAGSLRLAAWMIDRHSIDADHIAILQRWRKALTLSNEHRDDIKQFMRILGRLKDWPSMPTAQRKRCASLPHWLGSLALYRACGEDADTIQTDAQALAKDGIGLTPTPLLTGEDLIANGMQPGPEFKTLLDRAYDQQLEGVLSSREQAIAWLAELGHM